MLKTVLITALLLGLLLTAWVAYENYALSVEYVEVPIAGLPTEFDSFCIVQISDLHGAKLDPEGREVAAIRAAEPDIIAVTGDFVSSKAMEVDGVLPFLAALPEIAPVYAVSGNHDLAAGWEYIAGQLREAGLIVLDNEHVALQGDEAELILVGVMDPYSGYADLAGAMPPENDSVTVLLAHAPTWYISGYSVAAGGLHAFGPGFPERELLERVSLTLVGHTHGGQIKLPLLGAVTNASSQLFPRTHVEGLSKEGENSYLYINRGLGSVLLPLRFLARREITVITLTSHN